MLIQRRTRNVKVLPKPSLQANLPSHLQIPTRSKSLHPTRSKPKRRQQNLRAPRQRTMMKLLRSQVLLLKIDDPEACNARRWHSNECTVPLRS
eukprot:s1407_g5.t1